MINRYVISFNESAAAQDLVGTTIGGFNYNVLVERACQETIFRGEYFQAKSSRCVWFSRQDVGIEELKKSYIEESFSKFGKVTQVVIFGSSKRGIDGFVEFLEPNTVSDIVNKVVKAERCLLYCLNHWALLDDVQVPHQILLAMEGKNFMELKSKCSQKVFQSTLNCHWNHQSWFHTHYEQVSFLAQQHHWFQGKRSRSKDS